MGFIIFLSIYLVHGQGSLPMMKSMSLSDFIVSEQVEAQNNRFKSDCEIERKQGWFPENCYKLLSLYLGDPARSQEVFKLARFLEGVCLKKDQELTSSAKVSLLLQTLPLSKKCRRSLLQHLGDLKYADGD